MATQPGWPSHKNSGAGGAGMPAEGSDGTHPRAGPALREPPDLKGLLLEDMICRRHPQGRDWGAGRVASPCQIPQQGHRALRSLLF